MKKYSLVLEVGFSTTHEDLLYLEILEGLNMSDCFLDKISEVKKRGEKIQAMKYLQNSWGVKTNKALYCQKRISQAFKNDIAIHIECCYVQNALKNGIGWLYPEVSEDIYEKIKKSIINI